MTGAYHVMQGWTSYEPNKDDINPYCMIVNLNYYKE